MKKIISFIAVISSFASFSGLCASQGFDDAFAELDQSVAQSKVTTQINPGLISPVALL